MIFNIDIPHTGSRLPNISDVQTRKRRNMIGIHLIRNNRIATTNKSTKDKYRSTIGIVLLWDQNKFD
jgi:hypothetical protein